MFGQFLVFSTLREPAPPGSRRHILPQFEPCAQRSRGGSARFAPKNTLWTGTAAIAGRQGPATRTVPATAGQDRPMLTVLICVKL